MGIIKAGWEKLTTSCAQFKTVEEVPKLQLFLEVFFEAFARKQPGWRIR